MKEAEAHPGAKVLVHCKHGVSRSGACVVYYVMRERGCSLREALQIVKQARREICPNRGFFMQLQECEMDLFQTDQPSVTVQEGRERMWCSVSKFQEGLSEKDIQHRRYPVEWTKALIAKDRC